jgi:hypothetical protein
MKTYFSYQEDEAYKSGFKDMERNRTDMQRERISDDPEDIAYFDGQRDARREIEKRRIDEDYWNEQYDRENQLW